MQAQDSGTHACGQLAERERERKKAQAQSIKQAHAGGSDMTTQRRIASSGVGPSRGLVEMLRVWSTVISADRWDPVSLWCSVFSRATLDHVSLMVGSRSTRGAGPRS
ncbi:hypothetical protein AAC387_Pa09g1632 [Persea americana]